MSSSRVDARSLRGRLEVEAHPGPEGQTVLSRNDISAPFHVSKPYWTGDVLVAQAVNATAGVFAGDELGIDVAVRRGAKLLLTAPSAHRIHRMDGGFAVQRQRFVVESGAWFEMMPELFIPQEGSRYRQETRIELASDSRLFFVETLTPGRVARGEVFAFAEIGWKTEVVIDGELEFQERYIIPGGESAATWSMRAIGRSAYYASAILHDDRPVPQEALQAESPLLGVSRIAERLWCLRWLARDAEELRGALRRTRSILAATIPELRVDPRKL